jgi:hypothetical protein
MITANDLSQFKNKGISIEKVNLQLEQFKSGFPYMNIQKPASISDGIITLDEEQKFMFTDKYREGIEKGYNIIKFIPASGAATRMFKDLFSFIHATPNQQEKMLKTGPIHKFLTNIKYFAFSKELEKHSGINFSDKTAVKQHADSIIKSLLLPKKLNYGNYPKGVLKFHISNNKTLTPIEEHLTEGALYGANNKGLVNIHFTVSENHLYLFEEIVKKNQLLLEAKYNVRYNITYSTQKASTDTIAVNPDNTPFRNENGDILFRPGGHGALIENLNDLDGEYRLKDTIQYKEALAGILYFYQQQIFTYLKELNQNTNETLLNEILDFMQVELFITIPDTILQASNEEKTSFIRTKLDRPVRVCGMVKNEGEPGGGPFWGIGKYGEASLQIVESSQINLNNTEKQEIVKQSTHFNPVDLVCGIKDYQGQKFDLHKYVDAKTGFITNKSLNGKELKALELPGLWNGAMSDWTTIFVEVPITTFNPVKTVNDLLREQHQPESSIYHL